LLALRRQDDLPDGSNKEEILAVDDVPMQRAVDALRGVLLHAKEGTGAVPSKES
jgi:hypothetical protein